MDRAARRAVKRRHTKPCRYFQKGTCLRSDTECDFAHVHTLSIPTPDMYQRPPPCRFHHQQGYCRNGVNCRFSHAVEEPFGPPDSRSHNEKRDGHYSETYQYPGGLLFSPTYPTPPAMPLSPEFYPYSFWPNSPYDPCYSSLSPSPHYPEDMTYPLYHLNSISPKSSFDSSVSTSLATTSSPSHSEHAVADDESAEYSGADEYIGHSQEYQSYAPLKQRYSISTSPRSTPVVPATPLAYSTPTSKATALPKPIKPPKARSVKPSKPPAKYKTKQCKFYKSEARCPNGDKCTFIHENPVSAVNDSESKSEDIEGSKTPQSPPSLPSKPLTKIEDKRRKNFFPITWRVIGGGVLMGIRKPDQETKSWEEGVALDPKKKMNCTEPQMQVIPFPGDARETPRLSIDVNFPVLLPADKDTSPTRYQRGRASSNPSTPSTVHVDASPLFSAEIP